MSNKSYWLLLFLLITLSGCSTIGGLFGDDDEEAELEISDDISAELLYQQANNFLIGNQFQNAIESYNLLESRYPFGRYAQQAQLELAFIYYRQNNTEATVATIDRFLRLNPQHQNADYAHYIRALALFDSDRTFLNLILPRNPSNKDPRPLLASFEAFNTLVRSYPDSIYAEDAKQRMIYLRNELAEHELTVADFYMRRGAYIAAANRAKYVMENYQGAPSMPQAVYVLELAYRQLGVDDLADDTQRIYAANYLNQDGTLLDPAFATTEVSCADNILKRFLERLNLRTYYCN